MLGIINDMADMVCWQGCRPLVLLNIYLCRDSQLSMHALLQQHSDIQTVLVGAAQKDQSANAGHCTDALQLLFMCLGCLSLER